MMMRGLGLTALEINFFDYFLKYPLSLTLPTGMQNTVSKQIKLFTSLVHIQSLPLATLIQIAALTPH